MMLKKKEGNLRVFLNVPNGCRAWIRVFRHLESSFRVRGVWKFFWLATIYLGWKSSRAELTKSCHVAFYNGGTNCKIIRLNLFL